MRTDDFDFELPEELIAQTPIATRDASRLLVVDINEATLSDQHFYDIEAQLGAGDVLVINNTRVIPARLFGTKEETGAHVELLILNSKDTSRVECLVGNAKAVKLGSRISFGQGELKAECVEVMDEGRRMFRMEFTGIFLEVLEQLGETPLPPYIKEKLDDPERYQTVYAKVDGSAAAPTAGLHFNDELLDKLRVKGVEIIEVTLHVGLGTFRPVKVEDVSSHHMHQEEIFMDQASADRLNLAKREGRRIIAVGTTSMRTLETIASEYGEFRACHEMTGIFIYPGYEFKACDALITNFHLPKSTLMMLVSAFAGKDLIMRAYQHAIAERYRFFSFGDAMFLKRRSQ